MKKNRIGILTGGGDVAPLNAVIHYARNEALKNNYELIGFKNGWQGILEENLVSLTTAKINPEIGGTILKSSRVNIGKIEAAAETIKKEFEKLKLRGLIVIGGEDTLSNAFYLKELPIILISKTIDNDVGMNSKKGVINYFTLGYPTAASKISSFVSLAEGLRTTAYSHERIIVVESMGMHAGWLAISSAMGNPDFIIVPEFPLDYDEFKEKVKERYSKNKNVIIVTAEGSKWKSGEHMSADLNDRDNFGHPKFKGAAQVLAKRLKEDLKQFFDTRNVNSVNPSYLYRSGRPNTLDMKAGEMLGRKAVKLFLKGKFTSPRFLTTEFNNGKLNTGQYSIDDLENIEDFHRFIDDRYYNVNEFFITKEAKKYLSSIVPEIPLTKYGI